MQLTHRKTPKLQPYFKQQIDQDQDNIFLIRTARKYPQNNKKTTLQPNIPKNTRNHQKTHSQKINNLNSNTNFLTNQHSVDIWSAFKRQLYRKKFYSQALQNEKNNYLTGKLSSATISGNQTPYMLSKKNLKNQKKRIQKQKNMSDKMLYRVNNNPEQSLKQVSFQKQNYIRIAHSIMLHRNDDRKQQRNNSIILKVNKNRLYKSSQSHTRENSSSLAINVIKYRIRHKQLDKQNMGDYIRPWSGLNNLGLEQSIL